MRTNATFVAMLLALAPLPSFAQDWYIGLAAYDSGDYATALREWEPLAEQGVAAAQTNLGVMYDKSQGVVQDSAEAVRWYRLAAEQGDAYAQTNLGYMYSNGRGVTQDYVLAHMWYNIAAANGNSYAALSRETVADRMTPTDVSEAQRRARVCVDSDYTDCD